MWSSYEAYKPKSLALVLVSLYHLPWTVDVDAGWADPSSPSSAQSR